MTAPRGVTYTLSDYRALGPPFPGGLHFSYYPFLGGGGWSFFPPFFPLLGFTVSTTTAPGRFSLALGPRPQSQGKAPWGRGWGRFAVHWLKLTRACVSLVLQSVWCPVPLPLPPPDLFQMWLDWPLREPLKFSALRSARRHNFRILPKTPVPLIIIMFSLCWLRLLRILCVMFCLSCSSPSRSPYYIHTFKHPFVRYRFYLLLRPHPLLCP